MSAEKQTSWTRRLLFLPPLLLAGAALFFVASRQQPPERVAVEETARTVRVIEVRRTSIVPRVSGFGSVRPARVWNAVAQVSGQLIFVHPDFRRGAILDAATEILRVDPSDYELAIAEAQANIRAAEARLAELNVTEQNSRDLLALEKRSLELREAQLRRAEDLLGRGTVAQSGVDAERRDTISQRSRVKDIENTLRLLPTQIEVQQQQIAVDRSKLTTAELNLKRTRIKLPFRARISQVNVEETQYVQAGATLGAADGIAVSEVEAQFSIARISGFGRTVSNGVGGAFSEQNFRQIAEQAGLYAVVRLTSSAMPVEWEGRIVRASDEVAEQTRTVGIVAAVEGSYEQAVPGKRPPLTKGMFVEVELRSRPLENQIIVPRSALHDGSAFLVNGDGRLEIRRVTSGFVQGEFVVIEEGLEAGDVIVVSDISPAVPGMLLRTAYDDDLAAAISKEATGRTAAGAAQ